MPVLIPRSLPEAFDMLARVPEAQLLAGGTDFMVEVNGGWRRPAAVLALGRLPELAGWRRMDGYVALGAGLTYTEMMGAELASLVPGLAQAARTVGSPQIRNAGTLGGNLGTASPAGDTLPVLSALDAVVRVGGLDGSKRALSLDELMTGPKQTSLEPGDVITDVWVPAAFGAQEFLKVGTRNAMVIAVAAVALVVDWAGRSVRVALGSAGPVVIRARAAEAHAASRIDWEGRHLPGDDLEEFSALVSDAAHPIDDHRSTAAYRRHAVGVCAARALGRALQGPGVREEGWKG